MPRYLENKGVHLDSKTKKVCSYDFSKHLIPFYNYPGIHLDSKTKKVRSYDFSKHSIPFYNYPDTNLNRHKV